MNITKLGLDLWDPQKDALKTIQRFRSAHRSNATQGAALVQMPTGSGKTGVIAVAAHYSEAAEAVLILTPRVSLCEQLKRHVGGKFFEGVAPVGFHPPKPVYLWEGGMALPGAGIAQTIIICTIQKIQRLFKDDQPQFTSIAQKIGLVLVDEGHYEPALEWREAIRALPAPKVIFTATPFRNDFKLFDIDFNFAYRLSLADALQDRYIRSVDVVRRPPPRSAKEFVGDVMAFYHRHRAAFGTGANRSRVIIRCDQAPRIRAIAAELRRRNQTFVAIHETFNDADNSKGEFKHVPDPATRPEIYWIHQYKLLEGIDDSRFQIVAPYDELKSARTIVQQVGRVLRNRGRPAGAKAYFLDYTNGRQERLWINYCAFEDLVDQQGLATMDQGRQLVDSMQAAMPSLLYVDGQFRAPATIDQVDVAAELMLPLSANVFKATATFDVGKIEAELLQVHRDDDHVVHTRLKTRDTLVMLHVSFQNSPLLASDFFMEPKLGATVVHRIGNIIFFFATQGGTPDELPGFGSPLAPNRLQRLFRKHDLNRLTGVSLRSSNFGAHAVRTRAFTATSVRDTLPGFDDVANVCTTARGTVVHGTGAVQANLNRYLGFANGRISDDCGARVTFVEYLDWADRVATELNSTVTALAEFKRYAAQVPEPADPTPQHILLEVHEVADLFVTNPVGGRAGGRPLEIPDAAVAVDKNVLGDDVFEVSANGQQCEVKITYQQGTGRYHLESDELDRRYQPQQHHRRESLLHYLNREQAFRVIPTTPGYFFSGGQFFRPEVDFGPQYDDSILNVFKLLEGEAQLRTVSSEKGKTRNDRWQAGSIFHLLDERGAGTCMGPLLQNATIQVCDDMGTEAADFIFADSAAPRVVFAHAKFSKVLRLYSASALTEVCGQAEKNARYLGRFNEEAPPKAADWHRSKLKFKGNREHVTRVRRGPAGITGTDLWKQIRATIRDWRCSTEIWIVMGRALSISEFRTQLTANSPAQEAIQLAFRLYSTAQAANAVGARLRVICMP